MKRYLYTLLLCVPFLFQGAQAMEVTAKETGLVGHWAFENTLTDSTDNKLDGALRAPTFVPGIAGNALWLDGRTQQVEVAHNDLLDLNTYTISMWIRSEGTAPYATLLRKGTDERENYKLTLKYGNRLMGYALNGQQRLLSLISKDPSIERNQWQFVVMTFDGSVWSLWVDGKQIMTRVFEEIVVPAKNTQPLLIGNENNLHGRGFLGAIDDVKLYNYAFSAEEILASYRAVLPDASRANLVAHYDFEGGAKDTRTSGLDGAVRGIAFRDAKVGRGADFAAKDAHVEIRSNAALQMSRFSIETWMYAHNLRDNNYVYSKGMLGQEQLELQVGNRGELLSFMKFQNGDRVWFRTPRNIITPGTWYHVVQSFEDNIYRIYVDGVLVYERILQGKQLIATNTSPLFLGKKQSQSNTGFAGILDEFRIYNRALTQEEVRTAYHTGNTTAPAEVVKEEIAYWSLDRSGDDISGKGHDGKYPAIQYGEGVVGQAGIFEGRRTVLRVTDHNDLDLETFGISLWAKQEMYSNGRYLFIKGTDKQMNYALQTRMDGGLIANVTLKDGTIAQLRSKANVMKLGSWHHIVMNYTAGSWELWVDGVRVAITTAYTQTPQINASDLFIGNDGALSNNYFPGMLDEIRLFNYTLDPETIQELFTAPTTTNVEEAEAAATL